MAEQFIEVEKTYVDMTAVEADVRWVARRRDEFLRRGYRIVDDVTVEQIEAGQDGPGRCRISCRLDTEKGFVPRRRP